MDSRRFDADPVSFSWATWTDVGKSRSVNEDNLIALPGMFAVADGMGGHGGGDVAATAAVEALAVHGDAPFVIDEIPAILAEARSAVDRAARADRLTMMGTTMVAALWVERKDRHGLLIAHVGDSRCYELGPGGLRLVTRDHSVVQELIEAGEITPLQAEEHPDRHVVTRAFGGGSTGEAEYLLLAPAAPQRLLLCSDGVSGQLDDSLLAECLHITKTPIEAVESIASHVLAGEAPDNATAIVVDADWGPEVLYAASDVGADTQPHRQRADSEPAVQWSPADYQQPAGGRRR